MNGMTHWQKDKARKRKQGKNEENKAWNEKLSIITRKKREWESERMSERCLAADYVVDRRMADVCSLTSFPEN